MILGKEVSLAFGKVLAVDLAEALLRSVANSRVLLP